MAVDLIAGAFYIDLSGAVTQLCDEPVQPGLAGRKNVLQDVFRYCNEVLPLPNFSVYIAIYSPIQHNMLIMLDLLNKE